MQAVRHAYVLNLLDGLPLDIADIVVRPCYGIAAALSGVRQGVPR
jgi:hypothetical protein